MGKPNKGRKDQIGDLDVCEWMRRSGWVESGMVPAPERLKYLDAWFAREDGCEEEHF